jgi:hypothetical protein
MLLREASTDTISQRYDQGRLEIPRTCPSCQEKVCVLRLNNGGTGLRMTYYGYPEIKACVFARNEIGISSAPYTMLIEMSGSVILLNRSAAIEIKSEEDFECQGNFWGTKDPRVIAAMLHDGADNPRVGHVLFEPFETNPIEDAGSPLWDSVWVNEKANQRRRVRRR